MKFHTKYTIDSEKNKEENKDKKIISNDAFAVGELLDEIVNKLEHTRISALMKS